MAFAATMCTNVHLAIHMSMCMLFFVYILGVCLWSMFLLGFSIWRHKINLLHIKAYFIKVASKIFMLFLMQSNSFFPKSF